MLDTLAVSVDFDSSVSNEERELVNSYVRLLSEKNLPAILSAEHFSAIIGVNSEYIFKASNGGDKFYRIFKIPKRKHGHRIIHEPLPLLKKVQRWILDNVLSKAETSKCVNSYLPKKSNKSNARFHIGQEKLVKLDIENFFDSINSKYVYHLFYSFGYTKAVSTLLTRLCCINGRIPQGAPTSGQISNLVLKPIDDELFEFCRERGIRYTRYADDMSFSGKDFNPDELISFAQKIISKINLKLNSNKTKIQKKSNRQIVTGIVVNEKLTAPREARRRLRQEIHYIKKYGISEHIRYSGDADEIKSLNRIIGLCAYFSHIHKIDVIDPRDVLIMKTLLQEEKAQNGRIKDPFSHD